MPQFNSEQEVDNYWLPLKNRACGPFNKCMNDARFGGTTKNLSGNDYLKLQDECDKKYTIYVEGYGNRTCSEIGARYYSDKKQFNKSAKPGGGGPAPFVPSKRPDPPPPPPPPKLVSFGKMFLSFCLPALSRIAEQEGLDEVQINFYQLNESCGPVSLHSIAEFPVEIDRAEQMFADFCAERGGESMSVFDFVGWCSAKLFGDNRAVGYGMRHIFEPQADPKPDAAKKDDKAEKEAGEAKKAHLQEWSKKYNAFKLPVITIKLDTVYENENTKVDLLRKLTYRIGNQYNPPPPRFQINGEKQKRILRVDIYDRTFVEPHKGMNRVFKDKNGSYRVFEGDVTAEQAREYVKNYSLQYLNMSGDEIKTVPTPGSNTSRVEIGGVVTSRSIAKGKNVLKDLVADLYPTIVVGGTNATMVMSAQLQSKTDGLNAARQLTGGSYKAKSTVAPSGLAMEENELPLRALPAELSIATVGVPIADVEQTFFIDLGTGTTLDALYKVKQIQHNFSPGKYESSWTFIFSDGYATFFSATGVDDELRAMGYDTKQKNEAAEAAGDTAQVERQNYANVPIPNPPEAKK